MDEIFVIPQILTDLIFIASIGFIVFGVWMRSEHIRDGHFTVMFFGGWTLYLQLMAINQEIPLLTKAVSAIIVMFWVWINTGKNDPYRVVKTECGFGNVNVIKEWEKEHSNKITSIAIEEANAKLKG